VYLFGVIADKSNSLEDFFSTAEKVLFNNIRLKFVYTKCGKIVAAMDSVLGNVWE
jgi:hypothetical protein